MFPTSWDSRLGIPCIPCLMQKSYFLTIAYHTFYYITSAFAENCEFLSKEWILNKMITLPYNEFCFIKFLHPPKLSFLRAKNKIKRFLMAHSSFASQQVKFG
jgi:hypothetical protein